MIGFVRDTLKVLSMPCREHTALISRQLDEPLTPGQTFGLRVHVLYCTGCRRFRSQLRKIRALARDMSSQTGSGMPEDARRRLEVRMRSESARD